MTADVSSLREQLALACRMLVNEGLLDQSGHISARHPADPSRFFIHPHRLSRYEVTSDNLLVVSLDGQLLEGDDRPPSERFIHAGVYRGRPDVGSVCHIHSRLATVFSIAGRPLRAYMALQIGELAGYTDDELHGVAAHNWTPGSRQKTWDYYRARAQRAGLA